MYLRNPNKLPRHMRHLTRKTARKQSAVRVRPKEPPVLLHFTLPMAVSFALAPGRYDYNVQVHDNLGNVTVRGWDRAQVCDLAEQFLVKMASPPIGRAATIEDTRKEPPVPSPWQLEFVPGKPLTLTRA